MALKIRTTRGPLLRKLFDKKRSIVPRPNGEEQKSGRNHEDDDVDPEEMVPPRIGESVTCRMYEYLKLCTYSRSINRRIAMKDQTAVKVF